MLAAAFGVLVIWLNTNQYATGLALSLFGAGFSAFVGIRYTQEKLGEQHNFAIPGLADLPFVGPALFRQHPMVYLAIALTVAIAWFLYRSRAGLVLRAVGESPESAHALGYPVRRIRLAAVVVGGALCGVAGAYISVVYTPLWVEGMIAGKGWIALALTTFATWRPARVLLGAYLFGGVTMLQLQLQGEGVQISSQFLTMLPYLATILVLVLISRNAAVHPRQHAGVARQAVLPRIIRIVTTTSGDRSMNPIDFRPRLPRSPAARRRRDARRLQQGREDDDHDDARRSGGERRRRRRAALGAAPAPAASAPLKVAFAYVGPVGDGGWTFAHDNARKALEKHFGDKIADQLRREGARGGRRRARVPRHGEPGQQADLRHHLRLHGADAEGRRRPAGREVRARHRLQDRAATCAPTTAAPTRARTWPASSPAA